MARSRYDLFRRRLAPIAVVLALGGLAYETWGKRDPASETIELRLGAHRAEVRHVHAQVSAAGEPGAWLDRDLTAGGGELPLTLRTILDTDDATITVDLLTTSGPRRLVHRLAREPDATVIVDLGPELDPPARP